MRGFLVVVCVAMATSYFACIRPPSIGEVIERRGEVSISRSLPFSSTVRGGDVVSVGAGGAAKIQTEGGLQLELTAPAGSDGASIQTGYWWEMGGGPYLNVELARGRLDVKLAGALRHRWSLDFKAPGLSIHTYSSRLLDHAVQTDGKTTTVTTAKESKSDEYLRVSVGASTVSTLVEMTLGDTLVVGPLGVRHAKPGPPR